MINQTIIILLSHKKKTFECMKRLLSDKSKQLLYQGFNKTLIFVITIKIILIVNLLSLKFANRLPIFYFLRTQFIFE